MVSINEIIVAPIIYSESKITSIKQINNKSSNINYAFNITTKNNSTIFYTTTIY